LATPIKTKTALPARKKAAVTKAAPAAARKTVKAKPAEKPKAAPKLRKTAAKKPEVKIDVVEHLRQRVSAALDELKAKDVHEIDVRGKTSIADFLVIASGTSTRHVKSIADEVVKYAKKAGMMPLGVEGQREAEWVLVDLGDIIVHIMLPRIREFYGLERLWTVGDDAPAANAG
jgi:ribosome-associated protein